LYCHAVFDDTGNDAVIVVQWVKVRHHPVMFVLIGPRHVKFMLVGYNLCRHPYTQRQLIIPPPMTVSDISFIVQGALRRIYDSVS